MFIYATIMYNIQNVHYFMHKLNKIYQYFYAIALYARCTVIVRIL
jgi:hypothetical protein